MIEREPNFDIASEVSRDKLRELLYAPDKIGEYLLWKKTLPREIRLIVEAHLTNTEPKIYNNSLPLCREFLISAQMLLKNPNINLEMLKIDPRVRERLIKLQKIPLEEDGKFVNLFSLLGNKKIGFKTKALWYEAQAESRYDWLRNEDIKQIALELEEEDLIFDETDEPDEYEPHRTEKQEENEKLNHNNCLAVVMPFYGGYYKDSVYEEWDSRFLKWRKAPRNFSSIKTEELHMPNKHYYVSKALTERMNIIKLPNNWGVNAKSLQWQDGAPQDFGIYKDQNGETYISIKDENYEDFAYILEIAPKLNQDISVNEFALVKPKDKFPDDLTKEIENLITGESQISKARRIVKYIRDHLEYNDEIKYEAIYKKNPSEYFSQIWKYKKAKCDEANTLAVLALRKAGIQARFVGGHYVKDKDKKGAAVITDENRHAWLEVYDVKNKVWVRMDATPKGDPNLDQENSDYMEGDYGEQDAQVLSDQELDELRKQLESIGVEEIPEPSERTQLSKELNISEEKICHILERIKDLRKLRDPDGKIVFEEAKKVWQKAILKNLVQKEIFYFPLRMNEGEDLIDPTLAMIDINSGDYNPQGFEKREIENQEERLFGGLEVHIAADMSGSMAEYDLNSGVTKREAQRDALFLFVDSLMANAALSRANSSTMKCEMPVSVSVSVFGHETKVILPLTEKWTLKDQIKLYEELNRNTNGGTPDDEALRRINSSINSSTEKQNKDHARLKELGRKIGKNHRFVAVFCDGGSNNAMEVKRIINSMRARGIKIYGFGITSSAQAIKPIYEPDVEIIPSANELAGVAMNKLIEAIKDWYDIN